MAVATSPPIKHLLTAHLAAALGARHRKPPSQMLRRNMTVPFNRGYKALGINVFGIPHGERVPGALSWQKDMYLPGKKTIVLQPWEVRQMQRWRRTSVSDLADDIWTLGHEFGHYRQERARQPFNERQADMWGLHHLLWLARRMGMNKPGLRKQQQLLLRNYSGP